MTSLVKIFSFILFLALAKTNLSAQSFPKCAAMVGGKESGAIKRGEFLAQQGVGGMRHFANNHWEPIVIDSFAIIVLRGTSIILHRKNL
jgi:hypothetical protein